MRCSACSEMNDSKPMGESQRNRFDAQSAETNSLYSVKTETKRPLDGSRLAATTFLVVFDDPCIEFSEKIPRGG